MPINYPVNRKTVVDRMKTDAQNSMSNTAPFLRNTFIGSILTAMGGAIYDLYVTIKQLDKQAFLDTATGDILERQAALMGVFREAASQSTGYITITGVSGSIVNAGEILQGGNGSQFVTSEAVTLATQSVTISSLVFSGGMVTATTSDTHNLSNGNTVTISGADQEEYNITTEINVTGLNTFTYYLSGVTTTPATGSIILASLTFANALITSSGYGSIMNLAGGTDLTFMSILSGIDNIATLQYEGATGGTDLESDTSLRNRAIYKRQHPHSYFNVADIISTCEQVPGVTRVWVQEITPDVGQVTILFVRDGDQDIIPSSQDVENVYNQLMAIKPAHVDPDDVIVMAPTPVPINFKFNVLMPNSTNMQQAITNSLQAFFAEAPNVGENLSEDAYRSAIFNTVDPSTGNFIQSFVLAYPIGDIVINHDELPCLGTIQFV